MNKRVFYLYLYVLKYGYRLRNTQQIVLDFYLQMKVEPDTITKMPVPIIELRPGKVS